MVEPDATQPIRILLFAGLRETAGWSERLWSTTTDSTSCPTPRSVWRALALPGQLDDLRIAINHGFADVDQPLYPGDELAFLPPISGG